MGRVWLIVMLSGCAERALPLPEAPGPTEPGTPNLAQASAPDLAQPSLPDLAAVPDLAPLCTVSVSGQLPAPGAMDVPTSTMIQAQISCGSQPPDHGWFSMQLAIGDHPVDGNSQWVGDSLLSFVPAGPLALATTYTASVVGSPSSWQFTTRDGAWQSPAPVATLYGGKELSVAVSRNGHGVLAFGGSNADSLVVSAVRFDFDAGFTPVDPVRAIAPWDLHEVHAGIDDSGAVLLGWIEYGLVNNSGSYSFWTGRSVSPGSWTVAVDALSSPGFDWLYGLALRSDGSGLMLWRDGQTRLLAENSNGGSQPLALAQAVSAADVAIDPAGDAWVLWQGITDINVRSQSASGGWQTAQQLSSSGGSGPRISAGAGGVALASWEQTSFDGMFNDGNGTVSRYVPAQGWGTAQTLDMQAGHDGSNEVRMLQTGIDDDGDALALWINSVTYVTRREGNSTWYDTAFDLRGQRFSGGAWAPAHVLLDPGADMSNAGGITTSLSRHALAVAGQGNGFAVWLSGSQIRASRFLPDSGWQDPVLLDSGATQPPQVAIDSAGRAAAAWWVGDQLKAALFQ